MSEAHANRLLATGRMPATGETFISPTRAFAEQYDGVLVEFRVQAGTTDQLASIGVQDGAALTRATYPGMPMVRSGWSLRNAFFKTEGAQINIGLGRGPGLDMFNGAIKGFRVFP